MTWIMRVGPRHMIPHIKFLGCYTLLYLRKFRPRNFTKPRQLLSSRKLIYGVLHTTPLKKVSSLKLIHTWSWEQVRVLVSHLLLWFPVCFRYLVISPKDLH